MPYYADPDAFWATWVKFGEEIRSGGPVPAMPADPGVPLSAHRLRTLLVETPASSPPTAW